MRFEWDPAKSDANHRKHGFDFTDAAPMFDGPLLAVPEGQAVDPADPRIRTTLDLAVQTTASRLARRQLHAWQSAGPQQVAVIVLRRETREVLAAVGSPGYGAAPAYTGPYEQGGPGATVGTLAQWPQRALGGLIDFIALAIPGWILYAIGGPKVDSTTGLTTGPH